MSLKQEIKMFLGMSANELVDDSESGQRGELLNIEEEIERRKRIDTILERPFRELLMSNGYDPDKDFIFISKLMAEGLGITDKTIPSTMALRVRILDHLAEENIFLLKDAEELRNLPADGRRIVLPR